MDLTAKERTIFGKGVKTLIKDGFIPAELYGHGVQNAHLSVGKKDFIKAFEQAGESTIINLLVGNEKKPALIHEVQKDFVTDEIIHIDFHQVRMDEKISAHIPIEFTGEAPAVKEFGGVLNKTISEIEVEALPGNLPRYFEVDVSVLKELNQSIYVSDLKIPAGVEILVEPKTVIATITPPPEEEKVEETPVDVTTVKVEAEEKVAERAEKKAVEENKQ